MMKKILKTLVLFVSIATLSSCSDDDGDVLIVEESTTYQLASVSDPSISGTAKFIKNPDESVTIELQLNGTPAGGMHPAHIHNGTTIDMGSIALDLGTVDGTSGFSTITTTTLNDTSIAISYEDLLTFDGYINVHLSANELTTLVAQGDIGQNELTGASTTYPLASVSNPAISGDITFAKRANGVALATIDLDGTVDGVMYPAHIHMGSVATAPGNIIFDFASVNGTTGISNTNISNLNGLLDFFGYDDVLAVDGYVNVHNPVPDDLSVLVAQGNVGANN